MCIMDESFPEKRFQSNQMINCVMSGLEPTLHVNQQIVAFKISDKFTVDHLFPGFTDAA